MMTKSIIGKWHGLRQGSVGHRTVADILTGSSFLANMSVTHTYEHIFNKMVSALEWHPDYNLVLIGSRGGDISLVDLKNRTVKLCHRGGGRGQQITDIKCDLLDTNWYYTSSTSGKIIKQRLDGRDEIILKDTYISDEFYSSSRFSCIDVCPQRKLLVAGDSRGTIHLMPSCESESLVNSKTNCFSIGVHNSNILHTEFNKFNSDLFITASIDCTAKLWDTRMFSSHCSKPLLNIRHSHPLNSATFSLVNGSTLLITNYFDEISVYRGPNWQLERCIKHCHEQTQRFCLLKAKWHPLCELFLIGTFSSNPSVSGHYYDRPQAVDVIDPQNGQIKSSLSDGNPGVISISQFNTSGDIIAAIKGQNLIIFESIDSD
ncbi:DNA damage-binding protein 2-like [Oppia nitens]|uniref:DNA damage-binding protein 2-like n=1 Tax=Oppia nitens TaxID=1686743 RepID=UPI0023DC22D8|nr:DNA damage-binding protein 2-like [Oppia nitens]